MLVLSFLSLITVPGVGERCNHSATASSSEPASRSLRSRGDQPNRRFPTKIRQRPPPTPSMTCADSQRPRKREPGEHERGHESTEVAGDRWLIGAGDVKPSAGELCAIAEAKKPGPATAPASTAVGWAERWGSGGGDVSILPPWRVLPHLGAGPRSRHGRVTQSRRRTSRLGAASSICNYSPRRTRCPRTHSPAPN